MQKIDREWALLFCIFIAAFAVRLTTFSYPILAFDPYHHYAIGNFIAEGNGFPEVWELSNHPHGARITEPSGLYYVSVFLYRILTPFGISYLSAFKISPPLFGALTVLMTYLLAKELFGRRTALYSAVILAFLPAFLYRTFSGFYRGDTFSVFFMVAGFYLFLKSLDGSMEKRTGFAISAGICLGLMGLVWNGFLFGFVVLSAFVVIYSVAAYLEGSESRQVILAYALSAGIGVALIKYSIMLNPRAESYIHDLIRYIYPLTLGISVVFEGAKYRTKALPLKSRVYLLGAFLLAGALIAYQYFGELLKNLISGYGMVKATGGLMQTIGELRPPTKDILWNKYGIASAIAPIGALYLLKEKRFASVAFLFLIVWLLASAFIMKTAIRYMFIGAPPIAIAGALFLQRVELEFPRKEMRVITTAVLIFIMLTGIVFATQQRAHITDQWVDALEFLETQEPGGVFTWWDYGSWIQGIAGFPTTLDTVTGQSGSGIVAAGNILIEKDEAKAMRGLENLQVDYAAIPTDMIGQMTNLDMMLGLDTKAYQYPLFIKTADVSVNNVPAERYGKNLYLFNVGNDRVVAIEGDGKLYAFKRVYWREGGALISREYSNFSIPVVDKTVYISKQDLFIPQANVDDFLLPINPELNGALLTSLMLLDGEGFDDIELLYSNEEVKIYKVGK